MNVTSMLWRTSVSSYTRTILRLVLGLLSFRMLYGGLSKADFGFWSLLWSVFGYGVLVDFGLGFAAQKRVAELAVHKRWAELSRVLSTIVMLFLAIGAVVFGVAWFGSDTILGWFNFGPQEVARYKGTFLVFFVGLAIGFPLGIFPEILRGMQRVSTVNNVVSIALILNFGLLAAALHFGWSLTTILAISLATTIGPDLVCALIASWLLPDVKIRPSLFDRAQVSRTMQFSLWAYLITATNLVLGKTDQLIIGTTLSVVAVAVYVTGAKVSEIFSTFTKQLQEALSPAAAHLNAKGDRRALRDLLIQGTRLSVMVATPLYLLCSFYLSELMVLLTGDLAPSPDAYWTGQVLLAWYFVTIMTHGVSKRIFVMCGHERRLMWLGVGEAVGNLVLSVGLILVFRNVLSVAIGSLIPTLVVGWCCLWPWSAREAGVSPLALARQVLIPSLVGCVPMFLVLAGMHYLPWHGRPLPFAVVAGESLLALLVAVAGLWKFAFTEDERCRVACRFAFLTPGGRKV